ncbi:MAG TPA: glycerol kinase GlpK [Burkholderiales bacterium]|nr:glycerol kinase GlpK [Burkholderiales bacterium]
MRYILALDQGTTSSRALLFDEAGGIRATAQRETQQYYPQSGWVEQDPEDIWQSQLAVAREAIARADVPAGSVAAIGIANQRETTLLWDRASGQPVYRAIVWQDRRTSGLCEEMKRAGLESVIRARTGLLLDPYFSATKLRWLLDEVPGVRRRAEAGELAFGTVDSWLIWKLTDGRAHITDASNASRTLLYNLQRGEWDEELLHHLKLPAALLPRIVASSGVVADIMPKFLGATIPIAGIAGDQQAALFGQQCVLPGMAKNTYGTGCFMLMHTGRQPIPSRNRLLSTVAWLREGTCDYALEGSVFIAGAAVQWLRDGLGLIRSSEEVEALARSAADNGGVFLVPAFTGLGAPHWDPHARGIIVGLSRGSTAAHLARATLESIAYQTGDVLTAMHEDSGISLSELRVDGGAARNDLLMQFQADILGVPVVRPRLLESTALGAATLAAIGTAVWRSEDLPTTWCPERVFEPAMSADLREDLLNKWRRALNRAKNWEGGAA